LGNETRLAWELEGRPLEYEEREGMSEISAVGGRRHFSMEEEEALRRDEATNEIVKRDTKVGVDVRGDDRSWRVTKEHQQGHVGIGGGVEISHAAVEAAELGGLVHLGAAGAIGGPVTALVLGLYSFHEAQEKGKEQSAALAKDNAHVAVVGVLDLPDGYKGARLNGDYTHVPKEAGSTAFKMTEALASDKKGIATLQLHADRGMNAARDLARSGMTREAFLKANPRAAEAYNNDAAFREGFDAYDWAAKNLPPSERQELDAKLDERDGWYAQSLVSFRV
jgi:hypothetical protein